ncbi:uroporphyrinogen-III C-methyltransferase [Glutamicibacter sp. BW80]|uniref:uroporphyrinogen-III C-methyltransferase n=1 Tax=Glutamicibacter sp. BW80 TaxID=2024404 RepID=UPI000BB7FDC9|nr:uroporphyrinogen-III C-methyltransferase [Glutamicibacter sp. BW80]PCC28372.1 uroporphyrinogen-III C-methyltransferase [Glutamicibacter sp. BW80]
MNGTAFEIKGCTLLLAGERRGARGAAEHFIAQGAQVISADNPESGLVALETANLLVICDAFPQRLQPLREAAQRRGLPVLTRQPVSGSGQITLVGGGPGALDLLTVRAVSVLADADMVFVDRLGPGDLVRKLAPQAVIVDVGKQPGHHKVSQSQIEEQMLTAAKAGSNVVRLKGGDPFVFGRGFEEMAAASKSGIAISVVPGLSSCITVPAAAGIPVTARGVNRVFSVISGHDPLESQQLEQLTGLGGTIIILMGMGTLESTASGLLRQGMAATMPCAIVESGTTGEQRTTFATLATLTATSRARGCANPAVIVIGEVAALPQRLLAEEMANFGASA